MYAVNEISAPVCHTCIHCDHSTTCFQNLDCSCYGHLLEEEIRTAKMTNQRKKCCFVTDSMFSICE